MGQCNVIQEQKTTYINFDICLTDYEIILFIKWLEAEKISFSYEEHDTLPTKVYTFAIDKQHYQRSYNTLLTIIRENTQ
jgi:hypothetical protein